VSVDDFGTGYSSLSYLKKLPLDTLKIDQSFIHNLSENPDDAAIAIAIISMGQSLNLRVIAEGVESVEDLEFLKAHGCDEAQGFYFSHPVPPREFALLLAQRPFHPTPELI
jgi:EAL domain-containing protein (putative c-di-GMP-specific phosphodiesterase class I)